MRRTTLIPAALAALALAATSFAPADAAPAPVQVAGGLISPLSLAVADDGTVYVSQNFVSKLTKVAPGEDPVVAYADANKREIGGVSVNGDVVTFTATSQGGRPNARVYTLDSSNQRHLVADTWDYEKTFNPDGKRTYGIIGLSRSCKQSIPKKMREGVLPYKGIQESHPYSTVTSGGATYVGDAAGNDVLALDDGGVHTVAVLPQVEVRVTKKLRQGFGLPRCTQGHTFKGEPVPTDVEVGPGGSLYVTTLGGGLGESLPLGAVYRISPTTGRIQRVVSGLAGPVGIAFSSDGTMYISELFAGVVLQQPRNQARTVFAKIPSGPGDVEVSGTDVYVTAPHLRSSTPAGTVLKFSTAP